jgi:hypothetical protein
MGRRYQQQSNKECEVNFRVVEIYVARQNADGSKKNCFRFLLVDNRRETLETVQMNMHDFVRNAILVNRIENAGNNKMEKVSPDLPGVIPATAKKSCAPIQ